MHLRPAHTHAACPAPNNNKTTVLVLEKGLKEARQSKGEELLAVQTDLQYLIPGNGFCTHTAPHSVPPFLLFLSASTTTTSTAPRLVQVQRGANHQNNRLPRSYISLPFLHGPIEPNRGSSDVRVAKNVIA